MKTSSNSKSLGIPVNVPKVCSFFSKIFSLNDFLFYLKKDVCFGCCIKKAGKISLNITVYRKIFKVNILKAEEKILKRIKADNC
jgi:hypothetical protein